MNILIVSATEGEITPLLKAVTAAGSGSLRKGNYRSHHLDLLVTGVGMVPTAFHLGRTLSERYDLALNLGLAGSFNRNLEIGSVVNVMEDHLSEIGAEDGEAFLSLEQLKLDGLSVIKNDSVIANKVLAEIPQVNGITVNTVHGNEKSIELVFGRLHPYVESMEGAAFLYACREAGVPCAQLRAISNYVERRNRNAWNIPLALKHLNDKVLEILDSF